MERHRQTASCQWVIDFDGRRLVSKIAGWAGLSQSSPEGGQGLWTDVMLNAFSVRLRDAFGNSKATKEFNDGFVTALAGGGQFASGICEKNGTVRLRRHVAGHLQTGDGSVHGYVRHAQSPREFNHPGFTRLGREVRDRLHVIFRNLVRMLAACLGQDLRLWFAGRFPDRIFSGRSHSFLPLNNKPNKLLTVEKALCSVCYIMNAKQQDETWTTLLQIQCRARMPVLAAVAADGEPLNLESTL